MFRVVGAQPRPLGDLLGLGLALRPQRPLGDPLALPPRYGCRWGHAGAGLFLGPRRLPRRRPRRLPRHIMFDAVGRDAVAAFVVTPRHLLDVKVGGDGQEIGVAPGGVTVGAGFVGRRIPRPVGGQRLAGLRRARGQDRRARSAGHGETSRHSVAPAWDEGHAYAARRGTSALMRPCGTGTTI